MPLSLGKGSTSIRLLFLFFFVSLLFPFHFSYSRLFSFITVLFILLLFFLFSSYSHSFWRWSNPTRTQESSFGQRLYWVYLESLEIDYSGNTRHPQGASSADNPREISKVIPRDQSSFSTFITYHSRQHRRVSKFVKNPRISYSRVFVYFENWDKKDCTWVALWLIL